jgi:YVTN family beta-propeller protein
LKSRRRKIGELKKSWVTLALFLSSCATNPTDEFGPLPLEIRGVYVLNEGTPGQSNSSLSYYVPNPESPTIYPDVFKVVNSKELGDVATDMAISGNRAFIVVSGSDKVEVIRTTDNMSVRTILLPVGRRPFNILINGSKGYISNYAAKSVTVFDINTYSILTDSIAVDSYPQGMATTLGKVYVCNSGGGEGRTVSVINTTTDRVLRTVEVGDGPTEVRVTHDGFVWVLCTGSSVQGTNGKIFVIHPYTDAVVDSIPVGGHPFRITTSDKDPYYAYVVGDNRILRYNTRINQLETGGFVVGSATSFLYSVAVDDYTGDIYVGDATSNLDRNGKVIIYRSDGIPKESFNVGIVPGTILFLR